jgi:hypothetical protein
VAGKRIEIGPVEDYVIWTGVRTWIRGYDGGLPIYLFGDAPAGLVTPRQLREQRLRTARGQEVYALLVWRGGRRWGRLYRIDQAVPSRTQTPALLASVEAMHRSHYICRRCGETGDIWLPVSTWTCDRCCDLTGDWGQPAHIAA